MPWESAVPSDSHKQPGLPARCDLCGREAAPAKPYTLLSRVVTRLEKTISLAPPETASLTSDTKFKAHDFAVCSRCHGRKNVYLIISLALLAGWVWMAVESKGPLFPLLGLFVIFGFAIGSGRFLPVQRLARRIRRERKAAVAAASPGLRFYVEVLTPAAHHMRAQSRLADISIKRCGACKKEVPASSKVGDFCPHCGVQWGAETKTCGACRTPIPVATKAGDPCPPCGARWGA